MNSFTKTVLAVLALAPGCSKQAYDDESCDPAVGERDFSPVQDWAGEWCGVDVNRRLSFDNKGRLRSITPGVAGIVPNVEDAFGCEPGNWPLVLNASTTKGGVPAGGKAGPNGNGTTRVLEHAVIGSDALLLQYLTISPESQPDRVHFFIIERDPQSLGPAYYYNRVLFPGHEAPTLDELEAEFGYRDELVPLTRCDP